MALNNYRIIIKLLYKKSITNKGKKQTRKVFGVLVARFLVNIIRIELKLKYVGINKNWILSNVKMK